MSLLPPCSFKLGEELEERTEHELAGTELHCSVAKYTADVQFSSGGEGEVRRDEARSYSLMQ